ncbi:MAG: hypothetical protein SGJ11_05465 [Phycisphaerae bacterium]|nr:hypothetical protein [Phycisphaerae bacterium]
MRQLHDINGSKRGLGFAPATRLATVLAGLAATIGFATPALGQSMPVGTFTIRVNGGPVHSVQSFANSAGANGTVHFSGSSVDPSGAWEASWEYVADLDPNGNAKLTGNATVNNKSSESAEYDVTFEAPICPFIQSSSKMGGACTIKIITSANGGAVSTPGGNAVFAALADGAMGPKLFHGPFNMGSTGSGTAETANLFGAPFPNMATAAVSEAFGLRHMFKLTDGDIVIITSNLVLGGDVANFVACSNQQMAEAMPAAPAGAPADQSAMMVQGEPAAPPMPPSAATGGGATVTKPDRAPAVVTPSSNGAAKPGARSGASSSVVVLGGSSSERVVLDSQPAKKAIRKALPAKKSSASATKKSNSGSASAAARARAMGNRNR